MTLDEALALIAEHDRRVAVEEQRLRDVVAARREDDNQAKAIAQWVAERDTLRAKVAELEALLPPCSGTWLSGSGGHRTYAFDCKRPGIWDTGCGYVCDEHRNDKGGDDDAWRWWKERELLLERIAAVTNDEFAEYTESDNERLLMARAERDVARAKVAELTKLLGEACDGWERWLEQHHREDPNWPAYDERKKRVAEIRAAAGIIS